MWHPSHSIQVSVSHLGLTNSLLSERRLVFIFAPSAISSLQQPEWSFKNLSVSSLSSLSTFQLAAQCACSEIQSPGQALHALALSHPSDLISVPAVLLQPLWPLLFLRHPGKFLTQDFCPLSSLCPECSSPRFVLSSFPSCTSLSLSPHQRGLSVFSL